MNTSRSRTTKNRKGTYNSPRKVSRHPSERVERTTGSTQDNQDSRVSPRQRTMTDVSPRGSQVKMVGRMSASKN